ncbi:M24 family metallopeptidase [Sphingomonas psychrolutea]|uniref:Metallopeptidase n=1 Tax=Sphingomonas psychrolutea TaxID=1259676 RepID=A0ABQ1GQA8_9SPHN|nr:Xaa-Pro peptidase family protein [Sphingomonas psychrolutea]GGA48336.1 metallopeptidase [Sphingomonas psychrolutea]
MKLTRRAFATAAAAIPALSATGVLRAAAPDLAGLRAITGGTAPIGVPERRARIARAQALMILHGVGAVVIEPGSSMVYFTGVEWHRRERLTCAIIPAEGDPCIVTPYFEEPSVRQTLAIPAEVWAWDEDEDPIARVADWIDRKHLLGKAVAIEETVRFFVSDGLRSKMEDLLPAAKIVSANPIVRALRMRKTAPEIALMQAATDVTIAAYRWTYPRIEKGMKPADIAALMNAATRALGGEPEFALILIGAAAAYPHGSRDPQIVTDGQIVLMDCGCTVQGYQSDVSRTFVFGSASKEQRQVWDHVRTGQAKAFAAAQIGTPAGAVDDAVRTYYESLGYGPRYKLPGLSHRTGHGIGLDGHEPVNLVHGETTPLAEGMCFSDEPGLYLPGKFGVRLEDCFHMTASGPQWFSVPPLSLDAPFG